MLKQEFDEDTAARNEWYKRFDVGRKDVEDHTSSVCVGTFIIEEKSTKKNQRTVLVNKRIILREVAVQLSLGLAAQFDPKLLNFLQIQHN